MRNLNLTEIEILETSKKYFNEFLENRKDAKFDCNTFNKKKKIIINYLNYCLDLEGLK